VIDAGKDLNAYSEVEGQSACCPPPALSEAPGLTVLGGPCAPPPPAANDVHGGLAGLLERYDINEYAASVQVYAVKPL
jgi:hypothetical protein